MADDCDSESEREKMAALRMENQRLLDQKKLLLIKLQEGEKLKNNLKETRKDAKKLAAHKEKLRAALNDRDIDEGVTTERQKSPSATSSTQKVHECELNEEIGQPRAHGGNSEMELGTRNQVLRAKIEILIKEKRKLKEQNASLIQELAELNMKCEGQRKCVEQLESEIQRLSQIVYQQEETRRVNISSQEEDVMILKEQIKVYKEDFNKERSEREKLNSEKMALQEQLDKANITVEALQNQIREAGRNAQFQVEPLYPRGPTRSPYNVLPYDSRPMIRSQGTERGYIRGYDLDPLCYSARQPYGEGYSARAKSGDVVRRGDLTVKPRAFLSPDMTAVVDADPLLNKSKSF